MLGCKLICVRCRNCLYNKIARSIGLLHKIDILFVQVFHTSKRFCDRRPLNSEEICVSVLHYLSAISLTKKSTRNNLSIESRMSLCYTIIRQMCKFIAVRLSLIYTMVENPRNRNLYASVLHYVSAIRCRRAP